MKNLNVVIYGFIGLVIVSLLGATVYLYQDNLKKTAILEKQSPIADLPTGDIFKALEGAAPLISNGKDIGDRDALFASLNKETEYCGTSVDFAKAYFKAIEESLASARLKAHVASFKSTALSTLSAVILCMDNNSFINPPKEDEIICQGDEEMWPNFSTTEGASWGGCDFEIDKANETFKYCATFGEIKATCTETGCSF